MISSSSSPVLRLALCVAVLLSAGARSFAQIDPCASAERHHAAKPNFIFILTDDQDLMLQSLDFMPNVKKLLADQGATFTNFFVPVSLCCPSRTGILRGQYPHNHKIWANEPPDGGFQKAYADNLEQDTIATALEKSGYKTFFFGKYLNGYPATASQTYIPPGWDNWYSPVAGDPYGEYNYTLNSDGALVTHGSAVSDYLTDVMSAEAVNFLRTTAAQPGHPPFFMHITPFAPHRPSTPAPRHANMFPGLTAPRTPSFDEADVSDKPAYIQALPLLTDADIQAIDAEYRLRIQSLQAVDDMVGAIMNELQSTGLLADTYVFFASDNGYHMGQHRFPGGKYTPYETDIRVPLVVCGPGVPAAIQIDQFVGNVDLAPTIADLAGVSLATNPDGRSLVPLLQGQSPSAWRQAFLLEQLKGPVSPQKPILNDRQFEPPDTADMILGNVYPGHSGYRAATYKYVEYDTGEKELYYLGVDPDEMNNVASVADPVFLSAATIYLAALRGCAGGGCLTAEGVPPPSPVGAYFVASPLQPAPMQTVAFAATAHGTPPYTFTWNLGGQAASGQTVSRSFPAGTYTISLTVSDSAGARDVVTQTLVVATNVVISSIKAGGTPLKLTVSGSGFKSGCNVKINGQAAPVTQCGSASKAVAAGGALKSMLPKGVPVQVTVANPDGSTSAPYAFTR
jgi:N-acetylglucosamine-6-sulfatase